MKKILLTLFAVVLALGMVSCSLDGYEKMGNFLGVFGNNVYGIKPDMTNVKQASEKINSAITKNPDTTVNIDLDKIAELVDDIAKIKNSDQKVEALKEEMNKPVSNNASEAGQVKASLVNKLHDLKTSLPKSGDAAFDSADESIKDIINSVSDILDNIEGNISSSPTKADLVAVAIVNEMAKTAQDTLDGGAELLNDTSALLSIANDAFAAADALKVVSNISDIDLIGDIDLSSLLPKKGLGLEESAAKGKDDKLDFIDKMKTSLFKILDQICVNGQVDANKYASFALQCKAIRAAYDMGTWAELQAGNDGTRSFNDVSLYLISTLFSTLDDFAEIAGPTFKESFYYDGFNSFITTNKDAQKLDWSMFQMVGPTFLAAVSSDADKLSAIVVTLMKKVLTAPYTLVQLLNDADFSIDTIMKMFDKDYEPPLDVYIRGELLMLALDILPDEVWDVIGDVIFGSMFSGEGDFDWDDYDIDDFNMDDFDLDNIDLDDFDTSSLQNN